MKNVRVEKTSTLAFCMYLLLFFYHFEFKRHFQLGEGNGKYAILSFPLPYPPLEKLARNFLAILKEGCYLDNKSLDLFLSVEGSVLYLRS